MSWRCHKLWHLPEAMTDPFASLGARLSATLDSYRFSTDPKSLIDWAVLNRWLLGCLLGELDNGYRYRVSSG